MKALDKEGLDYLANKVYDAINSGGSADYIVEEGQNDIWYYRKWASGIAECWGRFISTVTWSKWGNVYQGNPSPQYATYPTGLFSTNPILSIVCYSTDGNSGTMGVEFYQAASTSRTPNFYAIRPDTGSTPASFQAAFDITARGLWKEFTPSVSAKAQVGFEDFTSQVTVNSTYFNVADGSARRVGNIGFLRYRLTTKSAVSNAMSVPILTLPHNGTKLADMIYFGSADATRPLMNMGNNQVFEGWSSSIGSGVIIEFFMVYIIRD